MHSSPPPETEHMSRPNGCEGEYFKASNRKRKNIYNKESSKRTMRILMDHVVVQFNSIQCRARVFLWLNAVGSISKIEVRTLVFTRCNPCVLSI